MTSTSQSRQHAQEEPRERSTPEWLTFGVSSALLLVLVGLVLYDWFVTPPMPPVVSVTQSGPVERLDSQYRVPWTIENTGGDTAESVQVIGELVIDGEVEEDAQQEIDFLSGGEEEEGAFLFTQDPAQGEIKLRVAGYKLP